MSDLKSKLRKRPDFSRWNGSDPFYDIDQSRSSMRPVQEVASGGELSRIMLALKSVAAQADGVRYIDL